jgi:hypothetical protein
MPKSETVASQLANLSQFPKWLKCPGANPLKEAHAALDTVVLTAYGVSAQKDLLAQLLARNQEVAAQIAKGEPVAAPGVPMNYPDAKKLVTEDCIEPALGKWRRPKTETGAENVEKHPAISRRNGGATNTEERSVRR